MERVRRSKVIHLLLILVTVYAALLCVVYIFQDRLVFFPERRFVISPRELGMEYEDVFFRAEDGTELHGWFVPSANPRGVILYCHGNGGNISYRIDYLKTFASLGLSTFIFDYRGYGKSRGTPTEQGTHLDAQAAWRLLTQERKTPPREIVLYGESLGGAIAARLAREKTPGALVLHSAFTSLPDVAADVYPFLPARLLSRYRYNTLSHVAEVKCPVLIIHSKDDEIVSYRHGLKLSAAVSDGGDFLELRGDHNTGFMTSMETYRSGLDAFLERALGRRPRAWEPG